MYVGGNFQLGTYVHDCRNRLLAIPSNQSDTGRGTLHGTTHFLKLDPRGEPSNLRLLGAKTTCLSFHSPLSVLCT
jgi:hypothetical protein